MKRCRSTTCNSWRARGVNSKRQLTPRKTAGRRTRAFERIRISQDSCFLFLGLTAPDVQRNCFSLKNSARPLTDDRSLDIAHYPSGHSTADPRQMRRESSLLLLFHRLLLLSPLSAYPPIGTFLRKILSGDENISILYIRKPNKKAFSE